MKTSITSTHTHACMLLCKQTNIQKVQKISSLQMLHKTAPVVNTEILYEYEILQNLRKKSGFITYDSHRVDRDQVTRIILVTFYRSHGSKGQANSPNDPNYNTLQYRFHHNNTINKEYSTGKSFAYYIHVSMLEQSCAALCLHQFKCIALKW